MHSEENQPVKVINGGVNQGVWALEIVAIRYAAWLSAEFEIRVYQTFQSLVRQGFDAMARLNKIDHVINTETKEVSQCASRMGKWGLEDGNACFWQLAPVWLMRFKCTCLVLRREKHKSVVFDSSRRGLSSIHGTNYSDPFEA
jgi:hypothetical protein